MKIALILILSCLLVGCVGIPVRVETDSAEITNDILVIKEELKLYADSVSKAVDDDKDRETLDKVYNTINEDLSKLHKRADNHYKDIKSLRDK